MRALARFPRARARVFPAVLVYRWNTTRRIVGACGSMRTRASSASPRRRELRRAWRMAEGHRDKNAQRPTTIKARWIVSYACACAGVCAWNIIGKSLCKGLLVVTIWKSDGGTTVPPILRGIVLRWCCVPHG